MRHHLLLAFSVSFMAFSAMAAESAANVQTGGANVATTLPNARAAATNLSSTANFNLAGGVVWKKFRKIKDKFVLGELAEGSALAIFNGSLKSKNQEIAAEARTILDAISETRDVLGERLEAARAAGSPDAEEWIRLYVRSFPSRRGRFARPVERPNISRSAAPAAQSAKTATSADIVIVGGTSAGIATAIQAQRMGKTAIVLEATRRIGGLTTGGLGQTDIGNKAAFGGIAREFYRAVKKYYMDETNWKWQKKSEYAPRGQSRYSFSEDAMWTFEPSAALKILEGWERDFNLDIRRGEALDRRPGGVTIENGRIVSVRTLSGKEFRGKMFVDCTYEGDLMAAAGVKYVVGREANSVYGETISGIQTRNAVMHQFPDGVDPYRVKGDPSSGLLPCVEPFDPNERDGDGDSRMQAYCFRMCLTDHPDNRIPFKKPDGYDEMDYELLFRAIEAGWDAKRRNQGPMPNRKTDTNNDGPFSTDFIGQNWRWPEASYEEREKIAAAHLKYQRGLMWTLANHPRIPADARAEYSKWGTCKDEFVGERGDGWQNQIYVREGRRLVGEYVMTEHNCRGEVCASRPIGLGAYGMDSHNVRRCVGADGFVHNEGDVQDYSASPIGPKHGKGVKGFPPYPIDYGAIIPTRKDCVNLFVPICLSASHMAYGSIRMEPVFFALGQAAGTAAAIAIDGGSAVQDVDYDALRARLLADGQVLKMERRN